MRRLCRLPLLQEYHNGSPIKRISSVSAGNFAAGYADNLRLIAAAPISYISEKMGEVCQNEDFVKAMSNLGFTVDYVDGAAAKERTIKWAEDLKPVFEEMAKIAG